MTRIIATDRTGTAQEFNAENGRSLMENLRDIAGMDVAAICGGSVSCATCHVYVEDMWLDKLPKQSPDEYELLEFLDAFRPNSRLSCQIRIKDELDGIQVTLAPEA